MTNTIYEASIRFAKIRGVWHGWLVVESYDLHKVLAPTGARYIGDAGLFDHLIGPMNLSVSFVDFFKKPGDRSSHVIGGRKPVASSI